MMRVCALLFALSTAPAFADKYQGAPPVFDQKLIGECLISGFYTGFGSPPPEHLVPDRTACLKALLPCHDRYDLPLDPELDLGALPHSREHQVRHCLFQHLEEAEWLGFQGVEAEYSSRAPTDRRVVIRSWLRQTRRAHEDCGARFDADDTNRVACQLAGVIEYVADRDAVDGLKARIQAWEESQ